MLLHWQTNMAEWDRSEGGSLINTDTVGINRAREIKRKRREQEPKKKWHEHKIFRKT